MLLAWRPNISEVDRTTERVEQASSSQNIVRYSTWMKVIYVWNLRTRSVIVIARLYPQIPPHFAWQLSALVSQTLRSSSPSHMTTDALPLWLQRHIDLCAHNVAHCSDLWHNPRLAEGTCAWSWRLCGIIPAITKDALDRIHNAAYSSTAIVASVALLSRIDFTVVILIITSGETVGKAQWVQLQLREMQGLLAPSAFSDLYTTRIGKILW